MKRLLIIGLTILALVLECVQRHLACGQDAFSTDLRELDKMRDGKRTPVDEVELRGEELLKEYTSTEKQGQIYCHLALVHSQSGIFHPDLVIEHAQRALRFPIEPVQRLRLYTYWGDALRGTHQGKKPFFEIRRMAAEPYLEGLKDAQKYHIPQQRPEMPMAGFYNGDLTDPDYKQRKKEAEKQIVAQRRARIEQDLWDCRRVLTGQIIDIYSRKPYAATELRQLATKIMEDPSAVDALMKLIEEKGALKDDPIPEKPKAPKLEKPKELPPVTTSSRWPPMRSAGALVIVVSGVNIWLRSRKRRALRP